MTNDVQADILSVSPHVVDVRACRHPGDAVASDTCLACRQQLSLTPTTALTLPNSAETDTLHEDPESFTPDADSTAGASATATGGMSQHRRSTRPGAAKRAHGPPGAGGSSLGELLLVKSVRSGGEDTWTGSGMGGVRTGSSGRRGGRGGVGGGGGPGAGEGRKRCVGKPLSTLIQPHLTTLIQPH